MGNATSFLLSLVVALPFIAGVIRYHKIQPGFKPFIVLLGIALVAEIVSRICIRYFGSNTVVIGIYSLVECVLLLILFNRWRPDATTRNWVWIIGIVCLLIWITENLFFFRIVNDFSPIFRICYSFVIVILSVNEINYLITHQNKNLLRNSKFILCIAFVIYFLYQILLEGSFYISRSQNAPSISNSIISLQVRINVMTNLIYLVAVLLIPQKSFYNFEEKLISMKTPKKRTDNM